MIHLKCASFLYTTFLKGRLIWQKGCIGIQYGEKSISISIWYLNNSGISICGWCIHLCYQGTGIYKVWCLYKSWEVGAFSSHRKQVLSEDAGSICAHATWNYQEIIANLAFIDPSFKKMSFRFFFYHTWFFFRDEEDFYIPVHSAGGVSTRFSCWEMFPISGGNLPVLWVFHWTDALDLHKW